MRGKRKGHLRERGTWTPLLTSSRRSEAAHPHPHLEQSRALCQRRSIVQQRAVQRSAVHNAKATHHQSFIVHTSHHIGTPCSAAQCSQRSAPSPIHHPPPSTQHPPPHPSSTAPNPLAPTPTRPVNPNSPAHTRRRHIAASAEPSTSHLPIFPRPLSIRRTHHLTSPQFNRQRSPDRTCDRVRGTLTRDGRERKVRACVLAGARAGLLACWLVGWLVRMPWLFYPASGNHPVVGWQAGNGQLIGLAAVGAQRRPVLDANRIGRCDAGA